MTIPPDPEVTVVKNHLTDPNNHPRKAVRVDAVVMASDTWRADHTGRVLGTSHTWTGENGCWRMPLLPYSAYDHDDYVYVQIVEDGASPVYIQVQPPSMGKERWLRDLMVDPPKRPSGYRPISRLRDLGDVDAASPADGDALVFTEGQWKPAPVVSALEALSDVDASSIADAPDGAVLVKRGDVWTAESPQLHNLADVDGPSLDQAQYQDSLQYLGANKGWGVDRNVPLQAQISPSPDVPLGVDLLFTSRDPSKVTWLTWDDSEPVEVTDDEMTHQYASPGEKVVTAWYDGDLDNAWSDSITIDDKDAQ